MNSAALKRIQDVVSLRAGQFPEDAGPLAHPIRPTSCITPSTFYTATVYSKGAEIIRMLQTLAGPEGYRRGTDLYFSRHDGQAVACEDFMNCIQETNPTCDLSTFPRWYAQSGSPTVTIGTAHDAVARTLTLKVTQQVPKTAKQTDPLPALIPMRVGLVGPDGAAVLVTTGREMRRWRARCSSCVRRATRLSSQTSRPARFRPSSVGLAPLWLSCARVA
jgi:aminopeptidase N